MTTSFALFNLGGGEIILILALIFILYGAKRLPEMSKGIRPDMDEFRRKEDPEQSSSDDIWSRNEIFLIVTLTCLTVIEVLAVGNWLLQ